LEASTVRALLDAAVQAPTAMHEQPWLFVVVQDRRLLRRISEHIKAAWADNAIATSETYARRGPNLHGTFIARLQDPELDVFHGAETLIIICARRIDAFVTADCWLAAENLMLAATALGLGTCCIGAAVDALNSERITAVLDIPADVHVVAPIVVGAPKGSAGPAARREPAIVSWK
jgi:nitroreductase